MSINPATYSTYARMHREYQLSPAMERELFADAGFAAYYAKHFAPHPGR